MNAPVITTTKPLSTKEMEEIADRIRARIRRTVEDIIESGRDLATVKDSMEFGEFTKWLDREFSMTDRTARNYMRAAAWAEGKTEIISDLSPTTLYLLAAPSTPKEIQAEVVSDLRSGKPVEVQRIKHRILDAKLKQRETAQAKWRNQRRKKEAIQRREREREREKHDAERQERERQQEQHINAAVPILGKLDRADLERLIELFAAIDIWHIRKVPIRALEDKDEDLTEIPAAFKRERLS
jgi:hypothetical protein